MTPQELLAHIDRRFPDRELWETINLAAKGLTRDPSTVWRWLQGAPIPKLVERKILEEWK